MACDAGGLSRVELLGECLDIDEAAGVTACADATPLVECIDLETNDPTLHRDHLVRALGQQAACQSARTWSHLVENTTVISAGGPGDAPGQSGPPAERSSCAPAVVTAAANESRS